MRESVRVYVESAVKFSVRLGISTNVNLFVLSSVRTNTWYSVCELVNEMNDENRN
jgi:hypothetical protein